MLLQAVTLSAGHAQADHEAYFTAHCFQASKTASELPYRLLDMHVKERQAVCTNSERVFRHLKTRSVV